MYTELQSISAARNANRRGGFSDVAGAEAGGVAADM